MLLWEIAELEVPYATERDISSIRDKVKNSIREPFTLKGPPHPEWKTLVYNSKNGIFPSIFKCEN